MICRAKDDCSLLAARLGGFAKRPPRGAPGWVELSGWVLEESHWRKKAREGHHQTGLHRDAMQDIMWQAANNDWLEYPLGSQLQFSEIPACYQK
jgi:hypothetical protein